MLTADGQLPRFQAKRKAGTKLGNQVIDVRPAIDNGVWQPCRHTFGGIDRQVFDDLSPREEKITNQRNLRFDGPVRLIVASRPDNKGRNAALKKVIWRLCGKRVPERDKPEREAGCSRARPETCRDKWCGKRRRSSLVADCRVHSSIIGQEQS